MKNIVPYPDRSSIGDDHASVAALALCVSATFLLSVSMGISAVIIPATLHADGISGTVTGLIMSLETIASILVSLLLPRLLRITSMKTWMILSTILRIPSLLLMAYLSSPGIWAIAVFLNRAGCFSLLVLIQTWVASLKFRSNRGLLVALYGTSMSLGLATGPLLLQHSGKLLRLAKPYLGNIAQGVDGFSRVIPAAGNTRFIFFLAALVSLMAVVPILSGLVLIPSFRFKAQAGVLESIMHARGPMFAVAMAGVSFFGVSAFISVYGLKNRMTLHESAMLLSCFMTGSLLLEAPLSWVSDFFDRRCFLTVSAFLCMICAAGLPVAITVNLQAFVLLFIWGGVTGAIYPTALAMIGEKYEGDDLIAANAGYALMDATGGTAGILLIGCSMDAFGPDGLPGVIMLSSIVFFSYLLSRYRELSAT